MEAQSLPEVYFDVESAQARYHEIGSVFEAVYREKPDFVVRSPGRVNIIGDHVDYSYFPAVPAAISFDIVMAVQVVKGPGKLIVEVANTDPRFAPDDFPASLDAAIDSDSWVNYFKCGWIAALKHMKATHAFGLRVVISGNVPPGGGLSSSAAFVVSSCLVTLLAHAPPHTVPISKYDLTKLSATCEQIIGVNSGGMDQAASVFGEKDHALLVSFRPELKAEPLRFPEREDPLVLLVADSRVVSEKLVSAQTHYNLRVVEVTLAANVLARRLALTIPPDGNLDAGTLYGVLVARYGEVTLDSLVKIIADVKSELHTEPYSESAVMAELGIDAAELRRVYMTRFPVRFETLKLQQRALHVYEETLRVMKFVEVMSTGNPAEAPRELGQLMNESQDSAELLYENSHPDCDYICRIAREAGSLGSRVTGAGWGGCTLHLVLRSKAAAVRKALEEQYYQVRHPEAPESALIESRPGSGTAVFWNPDVILKI